MISKDRRRFLKSLAFIAVLLAALASFQFFYGGFNSQRILQNARDNGVLKWDQEQIHEDDGYILVQSFGIGCSLIKRNGSFVRKVPGIYCNILPNGDLITSMFDSQFSSFVTKMRNNRRIWQVPNYVSRDVSVSPIDQSIWYINLEFVNKGKRRIKIDAFVNLSPSGEEVLRWRPDDHLEEIASFLNGPLKEANYYQVETIEKGSYGLFHMNSVQVIPPNDLMKQHPEFRAGNILISENYNGLAMIVDTESKKVVWVFQSRSKCGMHNARWISNNRILMFSNRSATSPDISDEKLISLCHSTEDKHVPGVASYVEEIDPISRKVVWSYTEPPAGEMCCRGLGSVQRRDNGNTVISHACKDSSIIEIDSKGKILWKWQYPKPINKSPNSADSKNSKRDYRADWPTAIYRADWLPNQLVDNWLATQ